MRTRCFEARQHILAHWCSQQPARQEVVIRPAPALCLPLKPRLVLSLHCHLAQERVGCSSGLSRPLASGAEPCAHLCPPQAQRWRSENFERPVDLEGSGDDDSFPDDELDDLYSGSGSGCKYPLPFSYMSYQQCQPPTRAASEALMARKRSPRRAGSLKRGVGEGAVIYGQLLRLKHVTGSPSSPGVEPEPSTPSFSVSTSLCALFGSPCRPPASVREQRRFSVTQVSYSCDHLEEFSGQRFRCSEQRPI